MNSAELTEQLRMLISRVDHIADTNQRLLQENRSLRHQYEQLANERAQLLAKNEQARSRVDAMIARLKTLEQNT